VSVTADTERVALFRYLPQLALPWVALGDWPTPLDEVRVDGKPIWIKREGDSNADYGGNKVRTLEAWLGHVRASGAERIWAIGAYGSNHAIATAIHARTAGLHAGAIVFPQPASEWAIENAGALIAAGIPIVRLRNVVEVPFAGVAVAARDRLFAAEPAREPPSTRDRSSGAGSARDPSSAGERASSAGAHEPSSARAPSRDHAEPRRDPSSTRGRSSGGGSARDQFADEPSSIPQARSRSFTADAGHRWLSSDARERVVSIFAAHLPRRDTLPGDSPPDGTDDISRKDRLESDARRTMSGAELANAARTLIARLFGTDQAKRSIVMPPGGATPIGTLGALSAAFELAEQVAAGLAPPPRRIVLPVGSTCTTAGLLSGLALAHAVGVWRWPLPIVHAVRVTPWPVTSRVLIMQLAAYTLARIVQLGGPRVELDGSRLVVDRRELGPGYGRITRRAQAAMATLAHGEYSAGSAVPRLDGVYSAKAAAALLRLHREGEGPLLFWSTKSTVRLDPPSPVELSRAPRALARWLSS
jgi:1-aminocyclopropane-1-carboxylate deaminase/D-cysteine desulfhydrase-like pyridoxal-dependent ACC family enzyme